MFSPRFLLKTATVLSRLSKTTPIGGRYLRKVSTRIAVRAIAKAVNEDSPIRACGCTRPCGREG